MLISCSSKWEVHYMYQYPLEEEINLLGLVCYRFSLTQANPSNTDINKLNFRNDISQWWRKLNRLMEEWHALAVNCSRNPSLIQLHCCR